MPCKMATGSLRHFTVAFVGEARLAALRAAMPHATMKDASGACRQHDADKNRKPFKGEAALGHLLRAFRAIAPQVKRFFCECRLRGSS